MIELIYHNDQLNTKVYIAEDFKPEALLFLGMRTLAIGCNHSGQKKYYHTLPIEHTSEFAVSFNEDGKEFTFDVRSKIWLAEPLHRAIFLDQEVEANFFIEKIINRDQVIIINCLDSCYGHSLDKLFNAQRHLKEHSEYGLILIVHPSLKHLVPEGVSEIWTIDIPIKNLNSKIKGFDDFVKTQLKEYKKVYLSKAHMNLDYSLMDIEKFTKCRPFPEKDFNRKPIQIAFILREDRFWLISRLNKLFYLAAVKFNLVKYLKGYFVSIQNGNFRSIINKIKNHYPEIEFVAVGLGKSGTLGSHVEDKRESYNDYVKHENLRDKIYSNSHLAIGVHGSHLLLASTLSASFISIHQDYKIQGFSEDFIPRHANFQRQALLGRFLSDRNSPSSIAEHIKFMLTELSLPSKKLT